jgi:hypothetical protein
MWWITIDLRIEFQSMSRCRFRVPIEPNRPYYNKWRHRIRNWKRLRWSAKRSRMYGRFQRMKEASLTWERNIKKVLSRYMAIVQPRPLESVKIVCSVKCKMNRELQGFKKSCLSSEKRTNCHWFDGCPLWIRFERYWRKRVACRFTVCLHWICEGGNTMNKKPMSLGIGILSSRPENQIHFAFDAPPP